MPGQTLIWPGGATICPNQHPTYIKRKNAEKSAQQQQRQQTEPRPPRPNKQNRGQITTVRGRGHGFSSRRPSQDFRFTRQAGETSSLPSTSNVQDDWETPYIAKQESVDSSTKTLKENLFPDCEKETCSKSESEETTSPDSSKENSLNSSMESSPPNCDKAKSFLRKMKIGRRGSYAKSTEESGSEDSFKLNKIAQKPPIKEKKTTEIKGFLVDDKFDHSEVKLFKKFDKVLIHGPLSIPEPFNDIDSSYLHPMLKKVLLDFHKMTKLQSYGWPTILRGFNVCTITNRSSKNGIFSYLPPLLQLTLQKMEVLTGVGLLTVILSPHSETCSKIYKITNSLVATTYLKVVLISSEIDEPLENCNLLITTPNIFLNAIKDFLIKVENLNYMAIDGVYELCRTKFEEITEILKSINQTVVKRDNMQMQIIVNSDRWSMDLRILLKHLRVPPFIFIENYQEASWYGQIDYQFKKIKEIYKLVALEDILLNRYLTEKTIVFCDEFDIGSISQHLKIKGLEVGGVSKYMKKEEILEEENMWIRAKKGSNRVLVCSDASFKLMKNILDATLIVNYTLPDNWEDMVYRWRCFLNKLPYVIHNPMEKVKIVFLGDDNDDDVMYNFYHGLKRNNVAHLKF